MLMQDTKCAAYINVQIYSFLPALHVRLCIPCIELSNEHVVISLKVNWFLWICFPDSYYCQDIVCGANLQHDCDSLDCCQQQELAVHQEYIEMTRLRRLVQHNPIGKFLLNIYNHEQLTLLIPGHIKAAMHKLQFVQDSAKVWLDAAKHVCAKKTAATMGETGETAVSADVADAVTNIQDPAGMIMVPAPFEQSAGQKKWKASRAKANHAKVTQSSTTNQPPVQMPAPLAPSSAQAQSSNRMQQPWVPFSHPHMSQQTTYAEPFSLPPPQAQDIEKMKCEGICACKDGLSRNLAIYT